MIASGKFSPIVINENNISFVYYDVLGNRKVLIKEFAMNITITKASVSELKRDGKVVGYQFNVE